MRYLPIVLLTVTLTGCALSSKAQYQQLVNQTKTKQFSPVHYGDNPTLYGLLKQQHTSRYLWVMIEGDGQAWINRYQPSQDPTPHHPIGAQLAQQMTAANVLYLSRPCQYLSDEERQSCQTSDWTYARFAEKQISQVNHAISTAKAVTKTQQVILSGYSGGGLMATLIAERRDDVKALITVAAPLEHRAWTSYHHISPLRDSFDTTHIKQHLYTLPQLHLVGDKDTTVPSFLTEQYLSSYPNHAPAELRILPGISHQIMIPMDISLLRSSTWSSQTIDDLNNDL